MAVFSLLFSAACLVCLIMTFRGMAALMFMAAVGFGFLPYLGAALGPNPPAGFAMAAEPVPAPAVSFKSADGKRRSLADFRGRVVLLSIWATWCESCRADVASRDRLQAIHGADGLEVLAVSVDDKGAGAVRRFLRESGVRTLDLYVDSKRTTQSALGAGPLPVTMLIDRNGNVVGSMFGAAEWDSPEALALVRRYLDG